MRTIQYTIEPEDTGKKVEEFLMKKQGFSRRVITALKKLPEGMLLNGVHTRTVDLLQAGDLLEINLPETAKRMPLCEIPVDILLEDEDVIVYNKPAGMPVHQSGGHIFGTLDGVYAAHCAATGQVTPFRPINRLDKDTTGAVVAARNQIAAGKLWKAVTKRYVAVVEGIPRYSRRLIRLPIERERPMELKRIVTPEGQDAVTWYRVLEEGKDCALLEFLLYTGRTHQIRVHMSCLGNPLVGDLLYGTPSEDIGRQALHCARVFFPHPLTGACTTVDAPPPEDFLQLLEKRGLTWDPSRLMEKQPPLEELEGDFIVPRGEIFLPQDP